MVIFFLLTILGTGAYITNGHDWGDDFSEYILQGISIADGSYATEHVTNGLFFIYPHGFPLLIAVMYRLFGFNLLAFKLISVVMYASFVAVFFHFCDKRLRRITALILAFLFAFSPCLYKLVDCILSDVSNMLFSFIALYFMVCFFDSVCERRKLVCSCAIGFFSFCAYICRDSGIVLPCTFAAMQVLYCIGVLSQGRNVRVNFRTILVHILPYIVFFLFSFWVNDMLFVSPARKQMGLFCNLSLNSIISNIPYYFSIISYFFYPRFLWFAVFTAIFWAMVKSVRQDSVLIVYFLGIMGLYIIWPIIQGIRYIVSALPVLIFFCGRAVELLYDSSDNQNRKIGVPLFVFNWQSYVVIAVLFCICSLFVCVVAGVNNMVSGRYLVNGSYSKEAVEMYQYINENISDDRRIFFFKPRVLFMTTGNASGNFQLSPDQPEGTPDFDYYLHTFDHGYGQLLSDKQASEDSFYIGDAEFTCIHENEKMRLFRRRP